MRLAPAFLCCLLAANAAEAAAPLTISGLVAQPVSLSLDDLRKLKQTSIEAMQMGGRGPVPLSCSGPALATVMAAATLALPEAKNANLRHTLLVTADDGYAVALSLGEIAENYGDAAPLLATACNGRPLEAPRLVLPRDKSAGRAVNGVVRIEVK